MKSSQKRLYAGFASLCESGGFSTKTLPVWFWRFVGSGALVRRIIEQDLKAQDIEEKINSPAALISNAVDKGGR